MDLVVIGHLLKEKIIFPDGREIGPVLGSPAAYASVASAKLGLKTGLVTKIGEDMPEELLEVFKKTGVDIDGMRVGKNSTANLLIYKDSEEKRLKFLSYPSLFMTGTMKPPIADVAATAEPDREPKSMHARTLT